MTAQELDEERGDTPSPDVYQWMDQQHEGSQKELATAANKDNNESDSESTNSGGTESSYEEVRVPHRKERIHLRLPKERTVDWRVNEGHVELRIKPGEGMQKDLISAWMNLNAVVNQVKDNDARDRSNERRRSRSLPPNTDTWQRVKGPTYTPTSSSTEDECE